MPECRGAGTTAARRDGPRAITSAPAACARRADDVTDHRPPLLAGSRSAGSTSVPAGPEARTWTSVTRTAGIQAALSRSAASGTPSTAPRSGGRTPGLDGAQPPHVARRCRRTTTAMVARPRRSGSPGGSAPGSRAPARRHPAPSRPARRGTAAQAGDAAPVLVLGPDGERTVCAGTRLGGVGQRRRSSRLARCPRRGAGHGERARAAPRPRGSTRARPGSRSARATTSA